MADTKLPPTFKSLLPFIRRAEELERDASRPESKLIAYYCRQYAMELGIKLRENGNSNEATNFLLSLMDRLEDDKAKLPAFTQDEGKEICEDFALEIFTKADDEDRAGLADKNTARTFYAAGTFFDILNQFGDVPEEILEKRRYCKYKAATILKAIKEGTAPTPGPPGAGYSTSDGTREDSSGTSAVVPHSAPAPTPGLPDIASISIGSTPVTQAPGPSLSPQSSTQQPSSFPSFTSSAGSFGPAGGSSSFTSNGSAQPPLAPPPAYTAPPAPAYSAPPAPVCSPPPPAYSAPPQAPVYSPPPSLPVRPVQSIPSSYAPQTVPTRNHGSPVTQNEINDAMECAKFAIAALKVKDIELAVQRLEMALKSIK